MNSFKKMILQENDRAKHKKYCKCGHSMILPDNSKVNKVICTHCGYYVYKNKKEEFKDRLLQSMKKSIEKN